jgi:hypothetical protein
VYPTQEGLPFGHFQGPTTLSKDRKTLLYVDVPGEVLDETVTVIALDFDQELEIYHGPGQAVEKN